MANLNVSAAHSLQLVPIDRLSKFAQIKTGVMLVYLSQPDNANAIPGSIRITTSIEGGSHGAVITLLGTSGTAPTVAHTPDAILLKGGKVFTATEGSQLTLRAFEVAGGEIIWIEQSRYENG